MNKYNNPRLLNTVVSGTGMKHPMLPHVVVGDTANGFIRGDLMDANAIVELVNNIIGGAPDTLDTLKEAADRIAALEHDTQDYQVGDTLANKVWNTMRGLQATIVKDGPAEELAIVLNWNNTIFDPHDEGRYGSLEIGVATSQKPGLMSTADKAALGAASALIPQIKQTIEDNELTVAAALNDLNSRISELIARIIALESNRFYYEWTEDYCVAGIFIRNEKSFIVKVYGDPEHNWFATFSPSTGKMISFEDANLDEFADMFNDLKARLELRYSQQVDSVEIIKSPVNVDEYIQDTAEYINISD